MASVLSIFSSYLKKARERVIAKKVKWIRARERERRASEPVYRNLNHKTTFNQYSKSLHTFLKAVGWLCMCVLDSLSTLGLLAATESEGSEGKVGRSRKARGLQGLRTTWMPSHPGS